MKPGGNDGLFLPDFCNVRVVFAVVIISELLAFVLTLAPTGARSDVWDDLSLISLFVQWVALSSAALLCLARPWLARFGNRPAAGFSYLIVLAVTTALSEVTYRIAHHADIGVVLPAHWHSGFLLRNLGIGAIVGAVALRYFYVQYQWKRHIEAEARARIQALQARIRPHFLFNSMNTIAA
ncbi:MAG: histidine kinase, partial [Gammaproteobacteria bacterium]|nr:histidine kinase [Gammaproteobacteria bacterium]